MNVVTNYCTYYKQQQQQPQPRFYMFHWVVSVLVEISADRRRRRRRLNMGHRQPTHKKITDFLRQWMHKGKICAGKQVDTYFLVDLIGTTNNVLIGRYFEKEYRYKLFKY